MDLPYGFEPAQERTQYDSETDDDNPLDPRANAAHELVVAYWNTADRLREMREIIDASRDVRALASEWEAARVTLDAVLAKVSLDDAPERAAFYARVDVRVQEVVRQARARVAEIEPERVALVAERGTVRAALVHLSKAVNDALFYG